MTLPIRLISYQLFINPEMANNEKVRALIKKISNEFEVISTIKILEHNLEEDRLCYEWFQKQLLGTINNHTDIDETLIKQIKNNIEEYYEQYLLLTRSLIQKARNEKVTPEQKVILNNFETTIIDSIHKELEKPNCDFEKISNYLSHLYTVATDRLKENQESEPLIPMNQIEKMSTQAKQNLAIASVYCIGKNHPTTLPVNPTQNEQEEYDNKNLLCHKLLSNLNDIIVTTDYSEIGFDAKPELQKYMILAKNFFSNIQDNKDNSIKATYYSPELVSKSLDLINAITRQNYNLQNPNN